MAKATRPVVKFMGIGVLLLGIVMFAIPYVMDAANRLVREPEWWETHEGVVAYFWKGTDMVWAFATGILILGLALFGASFALKD